MIEDSEVENEKPISIDYPKKNQPKKNQREQFKWWKTDVFIALALGTIALFSRLGFAAKQPTEWDSIHYVRALDHFDVVQYWPHAPGYWLYVFLGRLIRWVTPLDAYQSLLLLTALASAGTVACTYLVAKRVANRNIGIIAAITLMTIPFMWFYGSIVSTKSFDSLLLVLLLLLAIRARPGSYDALYACAILGLAGGIRQSAIVMFFPLVLYIVIRSVRSIKRFIACGLIGAIAIAVWFVPMIIEQPGGLSPIRSESNHLLEGSLHETSILVGSPGADENMWHVIGVVATALLPFIPFVIIGALYVRRIPQNKSTIWIPLALATLPGIAESFIVHFGTPGYSLSFLPGLVLAIFVFLRRVPMTRVAVTALAVSTVVVTSYQLQRFVFAPNVIPGRIVEASVIWAGGKYGAPYNQNVEGLRSIDNDQLKYKDLNNYFNSTRDVFVFLQDNGGYRYRYAGYQLPNYTMHLVNLGADIDQARLGRHTTISDQTIEIPRGGVAVFVLDSLPDELKTLTEKGQASVVKLSTGPVVYTLKPGNKAFGINFVEAPLPAV